MSLAFFNTIVILFFTLLGSIITGTMIAYVLSRFRFKLNSVLKGAFLLANLIPALRERKNKKEEFSCMIIYLG